MDNWRNISEWLEGTGYRAVVTSISQQVGGVSLPVENLEALVKIINQNNEQYNQYSPNGPNSPTLQIHFHGVASLSPEELKKILLEMGLTVVEKKGK